ncbi:imelysin family protein [Thalassovita mangrovi]|uniref:Peptidase M75 n=1 Tax=Thalassovita mangrovi TaxID=2692236 RepID=A0A6L8LM20_9RHOB|nr:imelysin family protein [Thalassovita mangrovi]MYM56056.1 peptidase M75 [Thalassovita mangrovi]
MFRSLAAAVLLCLPLPALAATPADPVAAVVEQLILPGFDRLQTSTAALDTAAQADCASESPALRAAYHDAFDAWVLVSHLRFGPTEADHRAFSLAFWPDTRGFTAKTLTGLLAAQDPAINDPDSFAELSIAGRGFYGMEYLLYDDAFRDPPEYACALIRATAHDMALTTGAIAEDWRDGYAQGMLEPGTDNSPYRDRDEVVQELYKAFTTGLQFTSDTRLGRPLGTFDRPRPKRAEAWRSGRSLRNVELSLKALREHGVLLAGDHPALVEALNEGFDAADEAASRIKDPAFGDLENASAWLRADLLRQSIDLIREQQSANLGAALGVAAGFNALDGD